MIVSRSKRVGFRMVPEVARLGAFLVIDGKRNRAGDPAFGG
jgi:hypothetical protein